MLPLAWPTWALAIGRKALDEDAAQYPDPKPLELARARPALPFDGNERALFVARVVTPSVALDFFGLGRSMSDQERALFDSETLGDDQAYIMGGSSTAILRGPGVGRSGRDSKHVGKILTAARSWWGMFDGQRITAGGSPLGWRKGQPWTRDQCLDWWDSWTELDGRPTQKQLAVDMGLSKKNPEAAVERWRATGLHWPPNDEELERSEQGDT